MPKDEWASTRRRDAVRRANEGKIWLHWWEKKDAKKKKKKKTTVKKKKKKTIQCRRCSGTNLKRTIQIHKNGSEHARIDCEDCGGFIKWGK